MFDEMLKRWKRPISFLFGAQNVRRQERLLARSGLFDEKWYLSRYPDVARASLRPIAHYLLYGADEGRDPSPLFHTLYYLSRNPDVAGARINALLHYILYGESEGRDPNPFFDVDWYRHLYPIVVERGQNALAHYSTEGWRIGCEPNPLFDTEWYRTAYPEAAESTLNPLAHYITAGAAKGYKTSPVFDTPDLRLWEKSSDTGPVANRFAGLKPTQGRAGLLQVIEEFDRGRGLRFFHRLRQIVSACDDGVLQEVDRTLSLETGPCLRQPKVSVVMPVFDRATLVKDAIGSVLSQTYDNLELIVCDDGSTDGTWDACKSFADPRIKVIWQANAGAAAARNRCLEKATGAYIAYLDSDNLWHPHFLHVMIEALMAAPGQPLAYANFFDITLAEGNAKLNAIRARGFDYELQLKSPFIDLNSVVHHRALWETFDGFDERLGALQDYDLIARYAWARDALHVPLAMNIYQRISDISQVSRDSDALARARSLIASKIDTYYSDGVPSETPDWVKRVSILSWDMSRNHFAKAHAVAEALSRSMQVQLISFRFFEEPVFTPVADVARSFELVSFQGGNFPGLLDRFCDALEAIQGDVVYAIKPRLTSFGLALLANCRTGVPVFLEANDLETMLQGTRLGKLHRAVGPEAVLAQPTEASTPHSLIWSQYLDRLAGDMPILFSHNENLNRHYGSKCLFMRNIKDETIFDPARMNRSALRRSLGVADEERVILFGGAVNDHKGVWEVLRFVDMHDNYRLFVVGSLETPELDRLRRANSNKIRVFPPQTAQEMAKLNHMADAVILWLDPRESVSHYQMPYKFTDAIAMGAPVVASPISDLAKLSNAVWHVPYGDFDALHETLQKVFLNDVERTRRVEAGRRLYRKEFTYRAARQNVALASHMTEPKVRYPVASGFAELFESFCKRAGADTQRLHTLLRKQ